MLKQMLKQIAEGKLVESKETFTSIISEKVKVRIEEAKVSVAQSFFEAKKEKEDDEEESEESDDESFSKHPLNQLQKIASVEPLKDEEKYEYTASGSVNKNSKPWTVNVPTFKHKDGSETNVKPEDAKHLANILQGSSIKPDTKQKAFDALHGSKEGFAKIHSALSGKKSGGKSIYAGDVRESFDAELDSELNEISAGLAQRVSSFRSKQANDVWYGKKPTAGGRYNPENPEYKKAAEKAEKAGKYSADKRKSAPAYIKNKVPEKYPLGGYDPKSNKSYSD